MKILQWIADRMKERSTWLGLTALAGAVGVALEPEQVEAITLLGIAIAGAIGAFTKDKPSE